MLIWWREGGKPRIGGREEGIVDLEFCSATRLLGFLLHGQVRKRGEEEGRKGARRGLKFGGGGRRYLVRLSRWPSTQPEPGSLGSAKLPPVGRWFCWVPYSFFFNNQSILH